MLPRKVAKMVGISVQFSFVEYDGCFLGTAYYLLAVEGSIQETPGADDSGILEEFFWILAKKIKIFLAYDIRIGCKRCKIINKIKEKRGSFTKDK